jgi:hypothetical protein
MAAGILKEDIAIRVAVTVTTSRSPADGEPGDAALSAAITPSAATKAATPHTTRLKRLANNDILATTPARS